MKKTAAIILSAVLCCSSGLYAELMARDVTSAAAKKENIDDSIEYLKTQVGKITVPAEKRAVYIFMASLQEQMALYDEAQLSYAAAAGIAAGDAENMPRKSNEQLVLDAVRCALSSGDWSTADTYLNSAVRNSKNQRVQAYIKLYTQWSALCKADAVEDLQEPVAILQAYQKVESMAAVQPAILLTLWYITGEKSYSKEICGRFPNSIEAAVVNGDVQLLPTPFWFFVPKKGEAEQGTGTYSSAVTVKTEAAANVDSVAPAASATSVAAQSGNGKGAKLQLGLFRTESNAKLLVQELKEKKFDAYITKETRASGTTYYIVLVNDDGNGNMADKLRGNGYECYVVE